ncbi:arylamine N-acetyltransferase family protein [Bacillus thuringiensis]|uniref:arylamine N-acetyltransferase family protein n=1 Tax=Bacillus thuringiensis TaxID=1428 RepID=UPI0005AF3F93|nr:arylamine N-acetyltransferase [Bacillus thuringiensis]KIP26340.1 N-acetyltransferase family protein [Bacillus thuringiensis serovar morrisoni]MCT6948023.1 arylamine N-acetyltransferase [Bacillus thuringiensis]MED2077219.1 arylamine N-acetyltransferase [Bacillus thuringiensis]NUW50744.1 arylamine N-acetyltransferase [Bacillus thuringiensis]HDR6822432.1 arylamine N-acetyltransferase [Bacillus thuringiensis]
MLTEFQKRFLEKLQISLEENLRFDTLHRTLFQMAHLFPYENIDVMEKRTQKISRNTIEKKLLLSNRGGLCYELNSLLYYFLRDSGFKVYRVAGTLYNPKISKWKPDDGHVIIIIEHKDNNYILDSGFASYLPLHPVPFNGEIIASSTGEYRVRKQITSKGTHVLEMRKGKNGETTNFLDSEHTHNWSIGFAFSLEEINEEKVNKIQEMIINHPESPLNKGYIICKLVKNGHISLTKQNFTRTEYGNKIKEEISAKQYCEILQTEFRIL